MARVPKYKEDPSLRDSPLTLGDIDKLIATGGKPLLKGRAIVHFLHRVRSTVTTFEQQFMNLHKKVDIHTAKSSARGQSNSLDPWAAAQFLTDAQRRALADAHQRRQLEMMHKLLEEIQRHRRRAASQHSAVRGAILDIQESDTVPEAVKLDLKARLDHLPSVEDLQYGPDERVNTIQRELGVTVETVDHSPIHDDSVPDVVDKAVTETVTEPRAVAVAKTDGSAGTNDTGASALVAGPRTSDGWVTQAKAPAPAPAPVAPSPSDDKDLGLEGLFD